MVLKYPTFAWLLLVCWSEKSPLRKPSANFCQSQCPPDCFAACPWNILSLEPLNMFSVLKRLSHYLAEAYKRWYIPMLSGIEPWFGRISCKDIGGENPGCLDDCSSRFDVIWLQFLLRHSFAATFLLKWKLQWHMNCSHSSKWRLRHRHRLSIYCTQT